jgi:hypothetical protein
MAATPLAAIALPHTTILTMETSVSSLLVGLIGDAVAEILNDEDNHPL